MGSHEKKEKNKKGSLVNKDRHFPSFCSPDDAVDIGKVMRAYKAAETQQLKESIDLFFIATPYNK